MSDIQSSNSKYTFWMLIHSYVIKIPIMQRDYAQGRKSESVTAIRDELLDTIYAALISEKNMDFDFVYGTLKEGILYPLDGQQRLTTLYLLHWYIACKERVIEEAREALHNFSYETRISSREFCEKLINLNYIPEEGVSPSEYIRNQNVYFDIWDKDPTIRHMLVMLDSIHDKFFGTEKELFPLLTRDIEDNPIITFNYLPMENYALTDDLYIKMNARGKNLSDFENFKAKFIQHMKRNGLPYEHFEASIDTTWTDLLWEYRSPVNNTIDEQFMYLFLFFTEMMYLEYSQEQKEGNSPFKVSDIRKLISFYDNKQKVEELYDLFDLWRDKKEIDECFDSVFSDQYSEGKVRIFDDNHNLLNVTINKNGLKVFNKIILFLFMKRCIHFKKKGQPDNGIQDYMRIIRNFVMKVRQRKYEKYSSDFRFCRHGIPHISFGLDSILDCEDIYQFIARLVPGPNDNRLNSESLKYEKDKADFIINNRELKEYIHRLEDMDVFRTSIHNFMPFIRKRHVETLADDIEKLIDSKLFDKSVQAMLSIADYGIRLGSSYFGDRFYYGSREKGWHTILSTSDRPDYPQIMMDFLDNFYAIDTPDVETRLEGMIKDNLRRLEKDDWRYYFLKYPRILAYYPRFLDSDNLIIMLEDIAENHKISIPHRLNGRQLTGYHACALYIEISMRLSCNLGYVERCKGSEDLGALLFKSGTKVSITDDGQVKAASLEDGDIADKIATIATNRYEIQYHEGLDYIQRLEWMSQNVLDAEKLVLGVS